MTFAHTLQEAQRGGWSVGIFTISTLAAVHGVLQAAVVTEAPVVIGITPICVARFGDQAFCNLVRTLRERYSVQAYTAALDVQNESDAVRMIAAGFDCIVIDSSQEPEKAAQLTRQVVMRAHERGQLVASVLSLSATDLTAREIGEETAAFGRVSGADILLVPAQIILDHKTMKAVRSATSCPLFANDRAIRRAETATSSTTKVAGTVVCTEVERAVLRARILEASSTDEMFDLESEAVCRAVERKISSLGAAAQAKRTWIRREL